MIPVALAIGLATAGCGSDDSATNDISPAKGSPQAQFEQQCKKNPSACG